MLYDDYPERYFLDHQDELVDENFEDSPMKMELLNNIWFTSVKNLVRSQKFAARDANFDSYNKGFGKSPEQLAKDLQNPYASEIDAAGRDAQNSWSKLYLDHQYDRDTARTWEELQTQLKEVTTFDDRTLSQQNFLAQKYISRYWMGKVLEMGITLTFFGLQTRSAARSQVLSVLRIVAVDRKPPGKVTRISPSTSRTTCQLVTTIP